MLPKITLVYDRKKNRKVEACVYYAGKRRYLATGITVPANASFRNGVISGCSTAPSMNKVLSTVMNVLMGQLQKQVKKDKSTFVRSLLPSHTTQIALSRGLHHDAMPCRCATAQMGITKT